MRPDLPSRPLEGVLDPASAFLALFADEPRAFWLDSGVDAATGTSFMGCGTEVVDGLDELRGRDGVWVGWLGYEAREQTMGERVRHAERYPRVAFLRVERMLAFDHATGAVTAYGPVPAFEPLPAPAPAAPPPRTARWRDDDDRYLAHIRECLRRITEGDAYQLCLTTEAVVDGPIDPVATYLSLRAANPSHHGGYIGIDGVALLSASPERFLRVTPDGHIASSPIKGTRPRGADERSDAALAAELVADEKERAENLMIVDLVRNDIGRVSEVGSVAVRALFEVESYATVHQLVSTVTGTLRADCDLVDVIGATFPAGSMTGAPKRNATLILDELEQRARGLYAGAFGWVQGRSADLAMTIRSIVVDADGATVGAGGGITALSQPERELAEVKLKAAPLLRALGAGAA
jgi:anthranilate synthase component 1